MYNTKKEWLNIPLQEQKHDTFLWQWCTQVEHPAMFDFAQNLHGKINLVFVSRILLTQSLHIFLFPVGNKQSLANVTSIWPGLCHVRDKMLYTCSSMSFANILFYTWCTICKTQHISVLTLQAVSLPKVLYILWKHPLHEPKMKQWEKKHFNIIGKTTWNKRDDHVSLANVNTILNCITGKKKINLLLNHLWW